MGFFSYLFQDWKANKRNIKGQYILLMYRFAQQVRKNKIMLVFFFWFLIIYTIWIEWILCCELSWHTKAGQNLQLHHGHSLVINRGVVIGNNCVLRQCTTIGNKGDKDDRSPVIGNNVNIGSNTCIIGNITIGDNVIIGAGSVVVKSVAANCVVAGNPAKVIRQL
ncbi:serine O-acetyltransferase [Mucilaginibacter sp.]|uniref:serine O-acetyltransferase n=1 Tax=Mucilaginibacter sp. TaxID=1882438 RepID=UPI003D0A7F8A